VGKRNISDEEIGLIKAMLKAGMRNDEAHFHFNQQDRLISPGRIAQIKSGKYGGSVPAADANVLDQFLAEFRRRTGSVLKEPELPGGVRALFVSDGAGDWKLFGGETDRVECKLSFRMTPEHRFAEVVKSIAGMANNKGGMILFGVRDGTLAIEGLADDEFQRTDPAAINRTLVGALVPVPHVTKSVVKFGAKTIGVLTIEPHQDAPVIALKMMGHDVKEGCIYYRYVGETRTIKPGELRQILALREQRAIADFTRRMMGVATGAQATFDLATGEVKGTAGAFVIDEALLPRLQFIKEGDFSEAKGAPALRLVGDVQPIDNHARERAKVIRDSITPDAVVRNFLKFEKVAEPLQYVHAQAHCQRRWLPVWYYAKASALPIDDLVEDLRSLVATHPASRDAVVQRLRRTNSAYKSHPGKPASVLERLLSGNLPRAGTDAENLVTANAIMGLPEDYATPDALRPLLLEMLDSAAEGASVRSAIYRAVCRVDEILCDPL
jgi:hypothetical protein